MIVCVCNGTSDRQVARAILDGANSLRDLQRCGIGNKCGMCHEVLEQSIDDVQSSCSKPAGMPCPGLCAAIS
jgi:bacterioferritin-associated ferredoxin